ncbi:MAG: hypothetical protein IKJ22_02485 [Paludibacteraceae bacterium]|nr:hypothetical protein [Paludibacteraceae bacterium]
MIVKTIRDYKDRETKEIYRVKDKKNTREVTDERGAELIAKGVVVKVETATKQKNTNTLQMLGLHLHQMHHLY